MSLTSIASFAFICNSSIRGDSVHVNVKRIIVVSRPVAITRSTIVLKNAGYTVADDFRKIVLPSDADNVRDVLVTNACKSKPNGFPLGADTAGQIVHPVTK